MKGATDESKNFAKIPNPKITAAQIRLSTRHAANVRVMTSTFTTHRGNRTKMTVTSGGGQDSLEVDYTYNLSNQLKKLKVTQLGLTLKEVDYISNGDGQRMQKTVLWYEVPFVTNYVLDGVHVILEKTEEGDTTMRYIPGVAMIMGSGETAGTRFYLHDVLGNVIALVNIPDEEGTPQVTQVYQYDGFGNPLILSQTWEMWNGALTVTDEVPNPYRWNGASGYYWDEDTGLYLMGLRWYDSTTGRFLTRDPIGFGGGDANLYRYVGNNPLNAVDPWGLQLDKWDLVHLAAQELDISPSRFVKAKGVSNVFLDQVTGIVFRVDMRDSRHLKPHVHVFKDLNYFKAERQAVSMFFDPKTRKIIHRPVWTSGFYASKGRIKINKARIGGTGVGSVGGIIGGAIIWGAVFPDELGADWREYINWEALRELDLEWDYDPDPIKGPLIVHPNLWIQ